MLRFPFKLAKDIKDAEVLTTNHADLSNLHQAIKPKAEGKRLWWLFATH